VPISAIPVFYVDAQIDGKAFPAPHWPGCLVELVNSAATNSFHMSSYTCLATGFAPPTVACQRQGPIGPVQCRRSALLRVTTPGGGTFVIRHTPFVLL